MTDVEYEKVVFSGNQLGKSTAIANSRLAAVRELLREALRHGLKEKTMHLIVESLRIIDSP